MAHDAERQVCHYTMCSQILPLFFNKIMLQAHFGLQFWQVCCQYIASLSQGKVHESYHMK